MLGLKFRSIRKTMIIAFVALGSATVATGAAGLFASWRLAEEGVTLGARLAPLSDAAMEIELTATHAHLLFEEIMAGDEGESIEEVWSLLDETRFYADAILHGGSNEDGTFHATESPPGPGQDRKRAHPDRGLYRERQGALCQVSARRRHRQRG